MGQGPAIELLSWLAEADLPDPEVVLADPDAFQLPERGDRAYAALSSVAAAVAADPTPERWERAWVVFGRASEHGAGRSRRRLACPCALPSRRAPVPAEVRLFMPLLRDAGLLD